MNLPTKSAVPDVKLDEPYDPDIAISTTPPDSPTSLRSPDTSPSSLNPLSGTSVLSNIHAVISPPSSSSTDFAKITSSSVQTLCGTSSTTATPLQTILNTIFGKNKQSTEFMMNTSETTPTAAKEPAILSPIIDPIVQQYKQTTKTNVEFDNNDRPYDPEEEYDPALGYQKLSPLKTLEISEPNSRTAGANNDGDDDRPYDPEEEYNLGNNNATKYSNTKPLLEMFAVKDEVAYDPEDDTVFEEMQNYLTENNSVTPVYGTSLSTSLSEQQKMLEDLNRQIEEQKRQLEEQEEALRLQRAAVGVSMAHFSVSDALMSPPPRFGREPDEDVGKTQNALVINLNRDPRQYRHLAQNAVDSLATGHADKEIAKERAESSKGVCLANKSPEQDLSNSIADKSLDKLEDKESISADTTVLPSAKNLEKSESLSKLQEGTSSSSGNKNVQHSHSPSKDLGKTKQSRTSRSQYPSPPQRRSRYETRRSYHEKRTSDQSKDDGHRRRGRHSPERSTRRSRSRSRKKERDSSRERERHQHGSTSSRRNSSRSNRNDMQYSSSRSRSTRRRTSPELEHSQSNQKEKPALRQKHEPISQSADSTNDVASEQCQIQSDKSKNGEPKVDASKPETAQSSHGEQTSSDRPCDHFPLKKQLQLEPNIIKTNPMQRDTFSKNKPQSDKLSLQHGKNNVSCNTGHQHGSQKGNMLHKNETDFSHEVNDPSSRQNHLPLKTPQIAKEDFPERDETYSGKPRNVLPQRPSHLRGNDPEMMLPKKQKRGFSTDDTLHSRDHKPLGGPSVEDVDFPELENNIHRNILPRDEFGASEPEARWRGPQQRMGGPRSHTPMQPMIPREQHPEKFESCRPTGPRGPRPRISDDCGPSPDFRPRGPTSAIGMFEGTRPRSLRPRGPSPGPRMFDEVLPHPSGPRGRFPRPGMFEGAGPRHTFSGPDTFDVSENFAASSRREFDNRDPHLQDFDDSWGRDAEADRAPLSEFRRPRGRGPPQQFHDNMLDSRDSEQEHFNDLRHCEPPFDETETGHLPRQYSDDPRDYGQNFANESFLNPQESTGHRNPSPCPTRTRSSAHARNHTHNQLEGPPFPGMDLNVKRSYPFDDFRAQSIEKETVEPHFAKPVFFKGGRSCERSAMEGPHFSPPQNLRGPRAPSPRFCDQRMHPRRNTESPEDRPCSPHFSLASTSKRSRPQGPNAGDFQNPMQSRIRSDGPVKRPDVVRPLRLSGPLLPTPPGGPIRFINPRMQRP